VKKSTVIMASAGSGKTFRLSLRFIALIAQNPDPQMPAKVLAATFSRKAAAEILERVILRLSVACLEKAQAHRLAAELLEHEGVAVADFKPVLARVAGVLHRLQVSTLDSYFARIGSCFKQELDLPAGTGVMEEEHSLVEPVRLEAITDVLEEIRLDDVMGLLQRVHSNAVSQTVLGDLTSLVKEVYGLFREAPDKALWTTLEQMPQRTNAQMEEVFGQMQAFAQAQGGQWVKSVESIVEEARTDEDWSGLIKKALLGSVLSGSNTFYKKPIPGAILPTLEALVDEIRSRTINRLKVQTAATYEWAGLFALKFDKLRRERGMVFFSDVPRALSLRLALDEEEGAGIGEQIYYRLDTRTEHLLLDEFQDTSVQQWGVLRPTAREIVSQEDRSLFIVGDVKQAIYGWRGGCPEIFRHVGESLLLPEDALEEMNKNWRSSQVVLDVVNKVFAGISGLATLAEFSDEDLVQESVDQTARQWQKAFGTHEAGKDGPGYVELRTPAESKGEMAQGDDEESDAGDESQGGPAGKLKHAQAAAKFARDLHAKHPEKSLCVLVSTNAMGFAILGALRRLGVNASGETGVRIAGDPAVAVVLAGLQLADHPGDKVAGFHVANSPLAKVVGLEGGAAPGPEAAGAFALKTREQIAEMGYAGLVSQWAKKLAHECSPENMRRLWQLVQLVQEHEALGPVRPGDLVRAVRQTQVQEPAAAKVRVMTIYRSKGLEFDMVVMPELGRRMGGIDNVKCVVLREDKAKPIQAVFRYPNTEVRKLAPVVVTEAYCSELRSRLTDELCALYVGMTRARSALYLLAPVAQKTSKGAKAANKTYLALLEEALEIDHNLTVEPDAVLFSYGDRDWDKQEIEGREQEKKKPEAIPVLVSTGVGARSLASVSPSSLEGGATVSVADLLALEKPVNRKRGVVFHAWFEGVGFVQAGDAAPTAAELVEVANKRFPGLPAEELGKWAASFAQAMASPVVRGALVFPEIQSGQTVELWRERDFVVLDDGKMLQGQFDRVVIGCDANGKALWARLLDFKTDKVTDETVAGVVEGYEPQIKAYLRALTRMLRLGEDCVSGELLFVGGEPRLCAV
jgi:ATP-dependent helicase/nuclease subunit A